MCKSAYIALTVTSVGQNVKPIMFTKYDESIRILRNVSRKQSPLTNLTDHTRGVITGALEENKTLQDNPLTYNTLMGTLAMLTKNRTKFILGECRKKIRAQPQAFDEKPCVHTKHMIKIALARYRKKVDMTFAVKRRVTEEETLFNPPAKLKREIAKQACNLLKHNGDPLIIPDDLKPFFAPIAGTDQLLIDTDKEITPEEIETALLSSGQDKAPGPSNLTTRHIRIGNISKRLAALFNRVLETGVVPVKWTKANMVFIPKGETQYGATLNTLRPITLLETIQKTFLKVLYSRITNVITQNKILKGANTSVLPGTSTHDSLLPLNFFLTETLRTGKPNICSSKINRQPSTQSPLSTFISLSNESES
jgi:hypothetical protein